MANGDFSVFPDDDYTGRMGPDGEPERYSTMRGGDPRVAQQQALAEYERRLQDPITLSSWMTGAKKDVRGLDPASQITLTPGTQYQIRDYTGKNEGQVIASGSTPEELLRLQDVARGLANQGRMADYRIEQVGGTPTGGLAQYRDPTTGEAVTLLGGDLYNSPGTKVVGDILKIAAPIALQFVPGFGTVLGTKLGLSGLAAKAAGVGLTSALGRAGAGLVTGENIGDALKAGAIGGLGSAATAGLLGATGVDKALGSALGSGKGALIGEGVREAAASVPGEILVSASRFAPTVLSGLSAASGSLLGDVGKSLVQPDRFQQALDRARLDNELGLGDIVVTGSKNAATSPLSQLASGVASSGFDQFLSNNAGMVGDGTPEPAAAEEPGIVVTSRPYPNVDLTGGLATVPVSTLLNLGINTPTDVSLSDAEIDVEGRRIRPGRISDALPAATGALNLGKPTDVSLSDAEIDVEGKRIRPGRVSDSLAAATGAVIPSQPPPVVDPGDIVVTGQKIKPAEIGGKPTDLLAPVIGEFVASDIVGGGKSLEQEQAEKDGKKKDTLDKIADAATIAGLVIPAIGALAGGGKGGGTGTYIPGGGSFDPNFSAKLPTPGEGGAFTVGGLGPATGPNPLAARSAADYYRYATGLAMDIPRGVDLSRATSPYAGFGPGTLGEETFNRITTGMAHGGPMGYARGSSRESFAVEGPGTGRSDDIPAVLSDGEYVIDAETVALLGDGSSRAGAKKLDELRVKVRKHKGKNLAKGKFSVNAKHPEAYMRGGRI